VTPVLTVLLLISAIVLCATGVWAFVQVASASRSVRQLADDVEERIVPLAEKADVTVDAMNAELLRVDAIVSQIEEVSERVSAASSAVATIVNAPMGAVSELSERLRRVMAARKAKER
jgi:vacuolar-type H+-ATPase subunit I/STV1